MLQLKKDGPVRELVLVGKQVFTQAAFESGPRSMQLVQQSATSIAENIDAWSTNKMPT